MLKASDKKKLRDGLRKSPSDTSPASLTGSTYTALAKELETRFGIKATPRSIRHYVYTIAREDKDWTRKPLTKGRPRKIAMTSPDQLVEEVSTYLMQLTGFSESGMYRILRDASSQRWPPMGKVSFHKLFKISRAGRSVISLKPSNHPLTQCCLIIGECRLTPPECSDQWLLQWGIEATTSFFNFQLINLLSTDDQRAPKRGRPRKSTTEMAALRDCEGRILLPAPVIQGFRDDCQRRLGLPLNRVILPKGYSADMFRQPSIETYQATPTLLLTREALASLPDILSLQSHLEDASIRHYQKTARPFISRLRRNFRELVERYRKKRAEPSLFRLSPETMPEAADLANFYDTHPPFFAKTIYQKHPIVRLDVKKMPDEPGKAG